MGSQRFLFDLSQGHIAQASGSPIKSIESVIELTGVGLPKYEDKSIYYLLSDIEIAKQTENVTSAIWKSLNDSAASQGGQVVLLNGSVPGPEPMLLPPSVSTQALLTYYDMQGVPLSHTVISDRPGRSPYADEWIDSFLDKKWPPTPEAGEHLLQLANVLADALHRLITKDSKPIPQPISGLKPAELMHCFLHNPGCELLRLHLEPDIVKFLLSINGPIPMQTYEPVDGHGWRVSHIAARLLMGLTGERLKECPPSKDYGSYTYLYGYYNGTNWCYKSLMETSTSFFFLEGGAVASPGWVRSALYENKRYVRLFRSSSPHEDGVSLALGILLTALIGSVAYVLRRFSAHIFVKPYDVIPDNQVVLPVNVM
uniref:Nicastrin n=1 Tax=Mesocestoides corti TaxID=53468 RepID=A0A5K3EI60_MESCO